MSTFAAINAELEEINQQNGIMRLAIEGVIGTVSKLVGQLEEAGIATKVEECNNLLAQLGAAKEKAEELYTEISSAAALASDLG